MEQKKQVRMTKQKKLIYEILASTKSHPTADWLYNEARKQLPDISLGTVYRNLQVLLDDGRILALNYGKEQCRYDANAEPHYHFVCEKCGRVLDFPEGSQLIDQRILRAAPGTVKTHRLECYGVCKDCQN
ncbi:MAG: transcriptional repressor [Bacillota bacterium]|nr:transcriptional repressor [Bacillota bacterium]